MTQASDHGLTTPRSADWRDIAACRGEDPDIFFASDATTAGQAAVEQALAVCRRCPAVAACQAWALDTRQESGVWGALTESQRRNLLRQRGRGTRGPRTTEHEPKQSLQAVWNNNAVPMPGGHARWQGSDRISIQGRMRTARQVAFILDRGKLPNGRVTVECGISTCVLPAHLADDDERARCGTRSGYQRHVRRGEPIDDACRRANTDADNRLRRTGTTKANA